MDHKYTGTKVRTSFMGNSALMMMTQGLTPERLTPAEMVLDTAVGYCCEICAPRGRSREEE